ncbi:nicotinate-nucleotide adenylyltransferase [Legionella maioricensis]|uniref:Probable nicotinate-nucleotide adenylyltransferase n=1 Tax=Legionella maioricensis TaxID=2896528 RepID=A0A9X2D1E0_9GAMM|nr:nicotinate-nucleotide adenylyltransferase [Legionella maioricensis]MCL9684628.1 nicotinate-nucleotide adenylyltransferase [Legionella maioricensis]MCL9687408.1 nicotinate-nucleotide adenylyltransferase [Legionella maioricensis]
MRSIAILGGTFDPVHNGHIQTSLFIQSNFNFDDYFFLPCKTPTLKPPTCANTQQRIEMLQLAIKSHPDFKLDLREIKRDSPSYMVETLASFRKENTDAAITLIMGYDAFLSLPQWYQWEKIIKLANLLVINRNQFSTYPMPEAIKMLLTEHKTEIKTDLLIKPAGTIYLFDAGNYEISSTHIREELKKNKPVETKLPKEVGEYIKQQELYR